jgi:hypothetical protein
LPQVAHLITQRARDGRRHIVPGAWPTGTLGMLLAIWVKHILGYDRLRPDDRGHACEAS